jgi:hypothetical protein
VPAHRGPGPPRPLTVRQILVRPRGLAAFVDEVVPILPARGRFRTEYDGRTLREHYGLPRPAHRNRAVPAHATGVVLSEWRPIPRPNCDRIDSNLYFADGNNT